jgi:hydroxymethylpyrimidine/phosphomethylpyrimidine kinase
MSKPIEPAVALTIAGSDSGAGAGIQADLLTFAANGVFGTTAITCLTAQNPEGVSAIEVLSSSFVTSQLQQVAAFFPLAAIKTGMLFNADIIGAVATFLGQRPGTPVVVDPVMVATSGAVLLQPEAIEAMITRLLPLATLITPNLDEAAVLINEKPSTLQQVREAAAQLAACFETHVLLKGGHLESGAVVVDVYAGPGGVIHEFTAPRIDGVDTHGSGCTLSSAIAAQLALGHSLQKAIGNALSYLHAGMQRPLCIDGKPFIRH